MMKPYAAQDEDGAWYADCLGVMQDPDPNRTEAQALRWALDRLWTAIPDDTPLHHPPAPIRNPQSAIRNPS